MTPDSVARRSTPSSSVRSDAMKDLAEGGMTMIVATSERRVAPGAADGVVLLADGGLAEQGTPVQVLDEPTGERGQSLLRQVTEH